jgi:mannose-6-phosphate isomerase
VTEAVEAAAGASDAGLAWIPRLAAAYPDDAGALAPLFLHLIRLAPGEAIFLPPRELHSYLRGFAVEVTASSDNVLRGGLTAKHVDRDELLRILRFEPGSTGILRAEPDASGAEVYRTPAEEFEVSTLRIASGRGFAVGAEHGVEVLLCTRGSLRAVAGGEAVELGPGRSCLVPAAAGPYQVAGQGAVWRFTVPVAAPARAPASAAP